MPAASMRWYDEYAARCGIRVTGGHEHLHAVVPGEAEREPREEQDLGESGQHADDDGTAVGADRKENREKSTCAKQNWENAVRCTHRVMRSVRYQISAPEQPYGMSFG